MIWTLRPAVPADAANLSELAERTFRESFAEFNAAEDMDLHCASSYSPVKQAAEIAEPGIHTLVAEVDGRLVGFAQVHFRGDAPACVTLAPVVELHRLYVDRSFHGTGLAVEMMSHVLELARQEGAEAVWLGVWERNPRAQRFYERSGFVEVGEHEFVVGTDPQRDLIMVRSVA